MNYISTYYIDVYTIDSFSIEIIHNIENMGKKFTIESFFFLYTIDYKDNDTFT